MRQSEIYRQNTPLAPSMDPNVSLPDEAKNIFKVEDLPDGSSIYEFRDGDEEEVKEEGGPDFYENLAEILPENLLNGIAAELLEAIEEDKESRNEWEQAYLKGIRYLGFKLEDFKDVPFMTACRAFDTTMSTALLRFYSMARAELFPNQGPATFEIWGEKDERAVNQGNRLKEWMNYYLTREDRDYYPDSERMLLYLGIIGTVFKKVSQDPITNKPIARFINPPDFIVNNNCVSILSSTRLTHVLHLNKHEIKLRQLNGYYRDVELPEVNDDLEQDSQTKNTVQNIEGINTSVYENKDLFDIYEVHCDWNFDQFDSFKRKSEEIDIPLPYIITICATSRKILAIRRNWEESDPYFNRIESFVQYNYLPGFGLYGIGLAQLIGSNEVALTSILRQLIDAGTLRNFPGGLKVKGLRIENNDKAIGPSEFLDVETGGLPIRDSVMPMPYQEPSSVLKELRNELIEQTQVLASTAETQIAENNANAPVGTTLAILEVSNKVQSSIFRSLHVSLTNELNLIYHLFSKFIPEEPYQFATVGNESQISRADFTDNIRIVPVSDPNLTTATQRILKAEALIKMAQTAPELYDQRKVHIRMLEALNVDDIEEVMPAPDQADPLDPISENVNALRGKPLKAAMYQDHPAHIISHMAFIQNNPELEPVMMDHIAEHKALDYLVQMQAQMGMNMPPEEALRDPQIQNDIAVKAAQIAEQEMQAKAANQNPAIDPSQLMMADIQQRREETISKDKQAKLKAETEAFKSQLKFEAENNKLNIQQQLAEEKNETALAIEEMKAARGK